MIQEAVVLAGGFGIRLRKVVSDLPKPMAPVNGKPFLHYILKHLQQAGITHIVLSVGYLAEKIESYFGNSYESVQISYCYEREPMGTGGGIRMAIEMCSSQDVLALNGDSFFDVPIVDYAVQHLNSRADASLALREVEDGSRYGTIQLDKNRIAAFREKSTEYKGPALINGGVYILKRDTYLQSTPSQKAFSIEYDFFAKQAGILHLNAYISNGYFIDIGIPEDYLLAQQEMRN
jgi:D-glycero-alpha-D-manno-heptose 1-phosphate guanylyltransferase